MPPNQRRPRRRAGARLAYHIDGINAQPLSVRLNVGEPHRDIGAEPWSITTGGASAVPQIDDKSLALAGRHPQLAGAGGPARQQLAVTGLDQVAARASDR